MSFVYCIMYSIITGLAVVCSVARRPRDARRHVLAMLGAGIPCVFIGCLLLDRQEAIIICTLAAILTALISRLCQFYARHWIWNGAVFLIALVGFYFLTYARLHLLRTMPEGKVSPNNSQKLGNDISGNSG